MLPPSEIAQSRRTIELSKPPPVTAAQLRFEASRLHHEVRELSNVVKMHGNLTNSSNRPRIESSMMVADGSADNPYDKLMRCEANGVSIRPSRLRRKVIVVVGLGGVGATVVECLARCGVERIIAVDRGSVALCHLGSLFYRPEALGWSKAHCVAQALRSVNPDSSILGLVADVCTEEGIASINKAVFGSMQGNSPRRRKGRNLPALVICCVDNHAARLSVCKWCLDTGGGLACIDAAVSHTALRADVRFVSGSSAGVDSGRNAALVETQGRPAALIGRHAAATIPRNNGKDPACLKCKCNVQSGMDAVRDEAAVMSGKEGESCSAHLASTDGVVAGMVVQQALKYLLAPQCPPPPHIISYDCYTDNFAVVPKTEPDPECAWCGSNENS